MEKVRFGLVGLGVHGSRYARHLAAGEVAGARLGMICRRDREQGEAIARDLGVPFTDDYRRVLSEPSLDAVALAVPCDLHPVLVPEALAAGKAVLVEKPLAPDAPSARRILAAAAARSAPPAMVAQTLRFNAVVREIRERSRDLGPLRFLSLSQRFEPSPRGWLDSPAAGGILRNTGIHGFDLARYLTGLEVERVICVEARQEGARMEDTFAAVLSLQGGILAAVDNARTTASRSGRIEWVGEQGQLAGDHVHHVLEEIRAREALEVELPAPVPTVRECLAAFTAAVLGETPVPVPLLEGVRGVEIVDACRLSAQTGLPQDVERKP